MQSLRVVSVEGGVFLCSTSQACDMLRRSSFAMLPCASFHSEQQNAAMKAPHLLALSTACALCAGHAVAGEDFQVRYSLSGTLGGEIFASPSLEGLTGGIAITHVSGRMLTGNDGKRLTQAVPGGTLQVGGSTPSPTYGPATAYVETNGTLLQYNLGLAWLSAPRYAGGRLAVAVSLPYGVKKQRFGAQVTPPTLNWDPSVPAAMQSAVQGQFDAQYRRDVAAVARAEDGRISDIGDMELHFGWRHADERLRVLAGASVVLPTGRYSAASGADIGFGNFYTLRPLAQVVYLPRPDVALAGRLTWGLNTRNRDNDLRSGNWASVESALGTMTRLGPVGVHVVHAQQFQDDRGNVWGASRYRSTHAGLFFTTRIPVIDTVLSLQYMNAIASRNAKHGSYAQVRMSKSF